MSRSDDGRPRLRVLITYDGTEPPRTLRRRPPGNSPLRPPLRAIAGGGPASRSAFAGAGTQRRTIAASRDEGSRGNDSAAPGGPDVEPALGSGETTGRLASLAGELHAMSDQLQQISDRLREAARRIENLVRTIAALEGLADGGPEALLEALDHFGLVGDEIASALALLSLLAEGPDEGRSDS